LLCLCILIVRLP